MMKKNLMLSSVFAFCLAAPVHAESSPKKVQDPAAAEGLSQVHAINLSEISAGGLARDRGQTEAIRGFGNHLVKDHEQADQKVLALAKQKGFNLDTPAAAAQLKDGQKAGDALKAAKAGEFDHKFAETMADGHAKAVKLLETGEQDIHDADVKKLFGELLPTVREHLNTARNLEKTAH